MDVDASAGPATGQPLDRSAVSASRWVLSGIVQGVGFRPFVYRLAHRYGLRGWVRNCTGRVEVVAGGPPERLHRAFPEPPRLADLNAEINQVRRCGNHTPLWTT